MPPARTNRALEASLEGLLGLRRPREASRTRLPFRRKSVEETREVRADPGLEIGTRTRRHSLEAGLPDLARGRGGTDPLKLGPDEDLEAIVDARVYGTGEHGSILPAEDPSVKDGDRRLVVR
jgi:hypothetical protein